MLKKGCSSPVVVRLLNQSHWLYRKQSQIQQSQIQRKENLKMTAVIEARSKFLNM